MLMEEKEINAVPENPFRLFKENKNIIRVCATIKKKNTHLKRTTITFQSCDQVNPYNSSYFGVELVCDFANGQISSYLYANTYV